MALTKAQLEALVEKLATQNAEMAAKVEALTTATASATAGPATLGHPGGTFLAKLDGEKIVNVMFVKAREKGTGTYLVPFHRGTVETLRNGETKARFGFVYVNGAVPKVEDAAGFVPVDAGKVMAWIDAMAGMRGVAIAYMPDSWRKAQSVKIETAFTAAK